ncbi:hypothetical protein Bbelb_173910 [Branchiostoma belcheri]|nr:hypothetical protein Bbelb_173910 [Branchiostoma belcheri]
MQKRNCSAAAHLFPRADRESISGRTHCSTARPDWKLPQKTPTPQGPLKLPERGPTLEETCREASEAARATVARDMEDAGQRTNVVRFSPYQRGGEGKPAYDLCVPPPKMKTLISNTSRHYQTSGSHQHKARVCAVLVGDRQDGRSDVTCMSGGWARANSLGKGRESRAGFPRAGYACGVVGGISTSQSGAPNTGSELTALKNEACLLLDASGISPTQSRSHDGVKQQSPLVATVWLLFKHGLLRLGTHVSHSQTVRSVCVGVGAC